MNELVGESVQSERQQWPVRKGCQLRVIWLLINLQRRRVANPPSKHHLHVSTRSCSYCSGSTFQLNHVQLACCYLPHSATNMPPKHDINVSADTEGSTSRLFHRLTDRKSGWKAQTSLSCECPFGLPGHAVPDRCIIQTSTTLTIGARHVSHL